MSLSKRKCEKSDFSERQKPKVGFGRMPPAVSIAFHKAVIWGQSVHQNFWAMAVSFKRTYLILEHNFIFGVLKKKPQTTQGIVLLMQIPGSSTKLGWWYLEDRSDS